jgi:hypothetical protein
MLFFVCSRSLWRSWWGCSAAVGHTFAVVFVGVGGVPLLVLFFVHSWSSWHSWWGCSAAIGHTFAVVFVGGALLLFVRVRWALALLLSFVRARRCSCGWSHCCCLSVVLVVGLLSLCAPCRRGWMWLVLRLAYRILVGAGCTTVKYKVINRFEYTWYSPGRAHVSLLPLGGSFLSAVASLIKQ